MNEIRIFSDGYITQDFEEDDDFDEDDDISREEFHNSTEIVTAPICLDNENPTTSESVNEDSGVDIRGCLVGVKAKEVEELHQLYRNHANLLGFSYKSTTTRKSKITGKILEKYYACSCEGFSKSVKSNYVKPVANIDGVVPSPLQIEECPVKTKKRKRMTIKRTGCKAIIRFKYLKEEDLYMVARHEVEHNHEMTRLEWSHHKRSERSISSEKGEIIKGLEDAGIKVVDSYHVLVTAAGGEEFVGHSLKDHYNFVESLRAQKIEKGDAQTVLNRLINNKRDEHDFYYQILLGDDGKLSAIFWRDSMMKEDFNLYGDVAIFDTTYTTNKYGLICAPIVGVNNHWNNVMFGCAFLPKETKENFVWLLTEFKNSMGGKEPRTIFTDQDMAMSNAIKEVFGDRVRHRLCIWHIQQNAVSHFGRLKTDQDFKDAFDHCLHGCVDETEFEACWNRMITTYNLENESWFKRLYGIREKWCTGLSRDFFSAGILSSQRSESTNHAISFKAKRHTNLTMFFQIFHQLVCKWRSDEQKKEFNASYTKPRPDLYGGLIRHVVDVYTSEIFRYFENEAKAAFAAPFRIAFMTDWNNVLYEISHENRPEKVEKVHFVKDPKDGNITVDCSCKHFQAVGWLCYHSIKALNMNNINYIPEKYIQKRWTKDAKKEVWDRQHKGLRKGENAVMEPLDSLPWRQNLARKYYDLMLTCHHPNMRKALDNGFIRDSLTIQQMQFKLDNEESSTTSTVNTEVSSKEPLIKDPIRAITKGRQKKMKTKFERKKPLGDVFGGKTQNQHLI